jgi:hypothetical protein
MWAVNRLRRNPGYVWVADAMGAIVLRCFNFDGKGQADLVYTPVAVASSADGTSSNSRDIGSREAPNGPGHQIRGHSMRRRHPTSTASALLHACPIGKCR